MPDWSSYRSLDDIERHTCGDTCVCPVHGTPMFYAASDRLHACQDPDCQYATGVDLNRLAYEAVLASETFRSLVPRELRHEFWPVVVDDECE